MCLAGTVGVCWPLTQGVAGWQELVILLQHDIFLSLNSTKFSENIQEKLK